jgi:hypothetical protein
VQALRNRSDARRQSRNLDFSEMSSACLDHEDAPGIAAPNKAPTGTTIALSIRQQ